MPKTAFITGITGQDGSYLTELLLDKNYEVHGLVRRSSSDNPRYLRRILNDINDEHLYLHHGDVQNTGSLHRIVKTVEPDEVYNLAAQSNVSISFELPEYTGEVNALGATRLLDTIRGLSPSAKYYQASTSEMFGRATQNPQNEKSEFRPQSPYGTAKLYAYWITRNYRDAYNLFASNGILFNHESPRRGRQFVTRKITSGVVEISAGNRNKILLGNLDASRDWGYAPEYVEAMWKILQHDQPDDFVVATGETHSVREFTSRAFAHTGINIEWHGSGQNEYAINTDTGRRVVEVDPELYRPSDPESLSGDAKKARIQLNWEPSTTFNELVKKMVDADREKFLNGGYQGK